MKNKCESEANNNKYKINKHLKVDEMKSELSNDNKILPWTFKKCLKVKGSPNWESEDEFVTLL